MNRQQKRIENLRSEISSQRKWLLTNGGSLAGYIQNYGDPGIPPLEDGKPKILSIRPRDVHLFEGTYEPVPGQPNHFYAMHFGNGGSAIWKADHDRLVSMENEYEMRTGKKA